MKRNYMLCFAGLLSLLLGGCAGAQSQMRFLGIEEAKRLATEEAGFSPEKVEFTETALNSRNGIDYYQIEFKAENEAYEYDIEALTGLLIDSSVPAAGAALDSKDSGAGGKDSAGMKMLTEEEAKEKALAHAGLTNEQAAFVKCKADHDDGVQIYNVEFYFSMHCLYIATCLELFQKIPGSVSTLNTCINFLIVRFVCKVRTKCESLHAISKVLDI